MPRRFRSLALAAVAALAVSGALARPAEASVILDVTYTDGAIDFGPLSFGLSELPGSVEATFHLGAGEPGIEPGEVIFDLDDFISANITFGDATWGAVGPNSLFVQIINGMVNALVYGFDPITTPSVSEGGVLNFPLTITGTDIASGQAFQYTYENSTQTLAPVPEPATFLLLLAGLAGVERMARRRAWGQILFFARVSTKGDNFRI